MGLFNFKKKQVVEQQEVKETVLDVIRRKARAETKRIVYPESGDERILKAADIVLREGIAQVILIGNPEEINKKGVDLGVDLSKALIINHTAPDNVPKLEEYAKKLLELRKKKGLKLAEARTLVLDPTYYATMMVYTGEADGLVSGATHTTADTLRPALQIIKTKEGITYASSFFLMITPDKTFFFADCAFIEEPTKEQLVAITEQTVESAKKFGFEPKVAMLAFSTKGSGKGSVVEKIRKATELLKKKMPDLIIDGEMQLDAAIVPEVAKLKCPNSPIQGDANILIFPDLNSGNIGYKLVERFGNTRAIGPIVQGLKKPVNDLSRGCSVEDIVTVTEITVVEAQEN
jgi:phosphate acetyltransferase